MMIYRIEESICVPFSEVWDVTPKQSGQDDPGARSPVLVF